ncbi:uncharacterized protein LOC116192098 isoform X2 [Punica granatum]|uniref:Uncharacterized protein LOC116192098 isoform X2 n=1 Tax=Punica granatum TaxID=22663 RepID=A0A6P8C1G3_PUNGR|nr:uncharacterized protein LOC116192098 isoform X2 [Punica granatum]
MASATVDSSATATPTATAADDSRHLRFESLPLIDLRLLSQSELYSLSLLSSPSPSSSSSCQDDVVIPIPKIDRSVFNESAGSRKQTYFRLRLAPRTTSNPPHPPAPISRQKNPEPFEEENSRIISLLKGLFYPHAESEPPLPTTPEDESSLIAVPVRYDESVPETSDSVLQSIPIGVVDLGFCNRKRGRPRKPEASLVNFESLSEGKEVLAFEGDEDENSTEKGKAVEVGDLDLFEDELRRRTEGMRTEEELSGFLRGLSGEWGSRRKKRKIVDARSLGDVLPNGWKLLLSIKNDRDRVWLGCSRYISPDGQQFESSKDVSAHLSSSFGVQDATHETSGPVDESSWSACKMASENSADPTHQMDQKQNGVVCLSAVPISSIPADHLNQSPLPTSGSPGKSWTKETYRCHKCTMSFEEKDNLLLHLLSSHKKSRSARNGATSGDSVIMKDGKYECQLCHKLFEEKNRYSSHFGNHIKDYVKRVEACGETNRVQRRTPRMQEQIGTERVSSAMPINTEANKKSSLGLPHAKIGSDAIPKTQERSDGHPVNIPCTEPVAVSKRDEEHVTEYIEKKEIDSGLPNANVEVVDQGGKINTENNVSKDMTTISSSPLKNGTSETPEELKVLENENKVSMDSVSSMEDRRQETVPLNEVFAPTENNNATNNESLVNRLFGSPMEEMDADDGDEVGDNVLISGIEDRCFGLDKGVLNSGTQKISSEGCSLVQFGREEKCITSDDPTGSKTSVLENESGSESRMPSSSQVLSPNDNQNKVGGRSQERVSYNSWNGKKAVDFGENVTERMVPEADNSFPAIPSVNQQNCDFDENVKGFSGSKIQNPWRQQVLESNLLSVHQKSLSPDATVGKISSGTKSLSPDASAGKISSGTMRNFQPPSESRSDPAVLNHVEKETPSGGIMPVTSPNQQAFVFNTHEARGPTFNEPKEYRGFTGLYAGDRDRVDKSGNLSVSGAEEKQNQGESMSYNKSSFGFDNRYSLQHGGPVTGFEAWANPPSRRVEAVTSDHRGATFFGSAVEESKRSKESAFGFLSPSVGHQQAGGTGYNLDMFYGGAVPDNRRADNVGTLRNEQMTGLYNQQVPKPREEPMAQSMWRVEQNVNILPNSGLNYVPSSAAQPPDCFPAFNMVSDKVQNEFYGSNQKPGNAPAVGGGMKSSGGGGFMEYNFLSAPSSGQGSHISSFNQQMGQGFESNWVEKEALGLFPKMGSSGSSSSGSRQHQVTALCVWCGNQFSHDGDFDVGDGSVGYMCFNCKAKFAGQINFF